MRMVEKFSTARTQAEPIGEHHFAELMRLNQDPEVAKTLGGTRTALQTRQYIGSGVDHWRLHGYGIWIFRDAASTRFIGRAGLRHLVVGGSAELELSYGLMPEFWRIGIATEMSHGILEVAEQLGLTDIVAFTLPTNLASRGVMEKVGFRYERDITWANGPAVLYRRKLERSSAPR
jgi:ribosomal-protein-alanine N-acetyltransferase